MKHSHHHPIEFLDKKNSRKKIQRCLFIIFRKRYSQMLLPKLRIHLSLLHIALHLFVRKFFEHRIVHQSTRNSPDFMSKLVIRQDVMNFLADNCHTRKWGRVPSGQGRRVLYDTRKLHTPAKTWQILINLIIRLLIS